MSSATSALFAGPVGRYIPQIDGLNCPSVARFGYGAIPMRCELRLGHEGLCEAHDGPVRWVWGTS